MKTMRNISIMLFCAFFCANSVSGQIGNTPHVTKTVKFIFKNHLPVSIFIGPHSDSKEKSGLTGWTEIKPNDQISLMLSPDSVTSISTGMTFTKLAFRLTTDKNNPSKGQDYLESYSKLKYFIHIAETKEIAENFAIDKKMERGIGFNTNVIPENNTAVCYLINKSSVAVTFTEVGHPFYGITLMSQDSLSINQTQRKILANTGFKTSKMLIIRDEGKDPISIVRTLPIYEGSSTVILTDEFFDLVKRENSGSSKVYPMKIRISSDVDLTIIGAYDSKGNKTPYIIPAGAKGEKGKIIYLKYGENEINLKYDYKGELPQTLIIRANERGSKWLKFQKEGKLKGKWILTSE
ncbi:MAG: hypothetical protein WCJ57_03385 [Candidatus Falkowbacteria bacterium]